MGKAGEHSHQEYIYSCIVTPPAIESHCPVVHSHHPLCALPLAATTITAAAATVHFINSNVSPIDV
jgi:hypothetical protein